MPWGKGKYQTLKPEKEEKPEETAATGPSEHPKTPLVHDETGPSRAPAEKLKGKEKAGKAPLPEGTWFIQLILSLHKLSFHQLP